MSWFTDLFPKNVSTLVRDEILKLISSPEFQAILVAAISAAIAGAVQGSLSSTDAQRPGKGPKSR